MKKILILILAALLLLTACGKADEVETATHIVTGLADGEAMTRKLLIGDNIQVQFFFATADAPDSVEIDGVEVPVNITPDGRFTIITPGLEITELDKPITFNFGNVHVETSVLAYIAAIRNSDKSPEVKAMIEALYKQYVEAR